MPGNIVTFYSYKGGTGRSMALANVAWILASNDKKVLTIDWDLEAPGLHRYFLPFLQDPELAATKGLIDLLTDYVDLILTPPDAWPAGLDEPAELANSQRYAVSLEFPFKSSQGCLHFLGAGQQDEKYTERICDFDWSAFYERLGGGEFLDKFWERLKEQYDFVLIDSRTGVADTSGICTVHMPDIVVLCFTYNLQSMRGIAAVAQSISKQRPEIPFIPVPMRVPMGIEGLEEAREYARITLSGFLSDTLGPGGKQDYWERSETVYRGDYAFHEVLAVFRDPLEGRQTLLRDMEWIANEIIGGRLPIRMARLEESFRKKYVPSFFPAVPVIEATIESRKKTTPVSAGSDKKLGVEHIRVFLISPGDVVDERFQALRVLEELPYDPFLRGRVTFEVVSWDKPLSDIPTPTELLPQEAIQEALPKPSECDIVIGTFWARMGTPLPARYRKPSGEPYFSGSEWELLDAIEGFKVHAKPLVLLYQRTEKVLLDPNSPNLEEQLTQWRAVKEFFGRLRSPDGTILAAFNEYDTPAEFRQILSAHLRTLVAEILEGAVSKLPESSADTLTFERDIVRWQGSPYPGLRTYTDRDAPIFFGRDRETDQIIKRLRDETIRFLAVVGSSGSGKSSLLWAGLIPRLQAGAIAGSQDWVWLRFTPGEVGDDPFMALTASLSPLIKQTGRTPRGLANELRNDADAVAKIVRLALEGRPDWAQILLFIDQLEELFTLIHPRERCDFIQLIAQASKTPRARIIATLRADFYHSCLEQPHLVDLLRAGSIPIAAPSIGALHEMITRPAVRAGLRFEAGLLERILNDTGNEPGALALMAFALAELYEARTADGQLTHAAYESFGGVLGAIGRRADTTFDALEPAAQAKLGDVFRELIEVDERGVATRRRALLRQVIYSTEAEKLVSALTDARLLVTGRGEGDESVVEVAQEALFRSWPRLAEWIQATADDLRLRRQITQLSAYWQEHGCDDRHRWPDDRVQEAAAMLQHLGLRPEDFTDDERAFLGPLDREGMLTDLDDTATSHEQRAIIGVRLSLLGDLRPGVGLREDGIPDIVWCQVPGGEITFEVEEQKQSRIARWLDKSSPSTFQIESFYIAKYPVIYSQYRAFLDADDGFSNPAWWAGLLDQMEKPGKQFNRRDNHPAENLCWLEAVAFCRWLSDKLSYEIRLPTEWEWQQAATGGDPTNEYPWGTEWDSSRTNTYESELSRSTAVGVFPHGASPTGALDMAGNVWEWCLNEYDAPSRTNPPGDASRTVRGGFWNDSHIYARAAHRSFAVPEYRSIGIGFRLLCLTSVF
jgi:formylglycine-generating enzyme required for sulfatase activity/MinD-like ATPase involved in chromosome partitioning or flagellar assembly